MSKEFPIRFEHDDQFLEILAKVNSALEAHGLAFESDLEEHDGFDQFRLHRIGHAPVPFTEGRESKGGQNPNNTSPYRPSAPQGSGGVNVEELLSFVRLAATPKRADGTYNYCREALEQRAKAILGDET